MEAPTSADPIYKNFKNVLKGAKDG